MSAPAIVVGEAERREIIGALGRAQSILNAMDKAMHAGVELQEPQWLFESVRKELDSVCGLVSGDLFVSKEGEILLDIQVPGRRQQLEEARQRAQKETPQS